MAIDTNFGTFYVDLNRATTAPEEAMAGALAEDFEELILFDELTEGGDFVKEPSKERVVLGK